MKTLTLKGENYNTVFCSGIHSRINEDGTSTIIEMSEEEELQQCVESIAVHVKRKEFDKVIKTIILNHLDWPEDEWDSIKIIVSGPKRGCEMNIYKPRTPFI